MVKSRSFKKNKNKLRTIEAQIVQKLKNNEPLPKSTPRGPTSHILMTGGPSDYFGSEVLAQSDCFGSMKYAGIFLGRKKKNRGIFWGCGKKTMGFFWLC